MIKVTYSQESTKSAAQIRKFHDQAKADEFMSTIRESGGTIIEWEDYPDEKPRPAQAAAGPDLHSPELESLIPAIIAAYESVRRRAEHEHRRSGIPIAVTYDRISNGEDETPFSFCPPASAPVLQRFGTTLVTLGG